MKSDGGMVVVSTELVERDMIISVQDNGIGMSEKQLNEIDIRLYHSSDTFYDEHIGLVNIHHQIKFYFGQQYGVGVTSKSGEGTTVMIRIPVHI